MENISQKDQGVVERFKNKAREFWRLWETLDSKKNSVTLNDPTLKAEYESLMGRGRSIRINVERVTGTIDTVFDYLNRGKDWLKRQIGFDGSPQLGLPILIPIAAIGISVAAMGKWITDAYRLNKRIEGVQKLINEGMSPELAAKVVADGMSFRAELGKAIVLPLVVIAGVIFFMSKGKG